MLIIENIIMFHILLLFFFMRKKIIKYVFNNILFWKLMTALSMGVTLITLN